MPQQFFYDEQIRRFLLQFIETYTPPCYATWSILTQQRPAVSDLRGDFFGEPGLRVLVPLVTAALFRVSPTWKRRRGPFEF